MKTTDSTKPWLEAISREEMKELLAIDDWRSWVSLLVDWGLVAASFALVAYRPNVLTVLVAIVVIGARQLGFAVIMHEAAHRTLFRNPTLNDWVGNWLAAYPIWLDVRPYRTYHLQHHAKTWTEDDPDLGLATPFPRTSKSLRRKIWRDLSGQTGWKRFKATYRRDLGLSKGKVRRRGQADWRNLRGVLITNAILLAALTAVGHPALYLLWVGAWFTTYSLVMRIRSIAEHAMIPDPANALQNTRTTLVSWWERLVLAPNRVNYHLEHHLFMTIPHYKLPKLHRMLKDRGLLDDACIEHGYWNVLRQAGSATAPAGGASVGGQSLTFG